MTRQDDLLDKKKLTQILVSKIKELDLSPDFRILSIERFLVLAPETYVLMVTIEDQTETKYFRINASTKETRVKAYETMSILAEKRQSGLPKNFSYIEDYNALVYENIDGEMLIDVLNRDFDWLIDKTIKIANWLGELHRLKTGLKLEPYDFKIPTNYLTLLGVTNSYLDDKLNKLKISRRVLIHGDFQPNNLIFSHGSLKIIDFNDAAVDHPLIDVATFLTQLKVMLKRFGDINHYNSLERNFFSHYFQRNITPDEKNDLSIYSSIILARIYGTLEAVLPSSEINREELLEFVKNEWRKNNESLSD